MGRALPSVLAGMLAALPLLPPFGRDRRRFRPLLGKIVKGG